MLARRTIAASLPLALGVLILGDAGACGGDQPPGATTTTAPPAFDASLEADAPSSPAVDAAPDHARVSYGGLPPVEAGPRTPVHADLVSSRVDTLALMFAAGEMQTSGEPFVSQFAGRNLADYDRYSLPPDQYELPVNNGQAFYVSVPDPFGFSLAVESYEYSKYHMNMVANQSGAGVSLVSGPLLAQYAGATPRDRLRSRIVEIITAAGTDHGGFATLPPPANNPLNDFGFPGLWPALVPYRSFDPTMRPDATVVHSCTTAYGYGGLQQFGNSPVNAYECSYDSLRLTDRVAQTEHVIGPGILGYATWKEALWAIDFTGRLHDPNANPVNTVAPADQAKVGTANNTVQATDPSSAAPGVYIGSTPLEGMWGMTMVDEMDNAAAWLLASLATADGATLSGLPSVQAAIDYDYGSPLVWFPTLLAVQEDGTTPYPGVSTVTIQDASSQSIDLAALAQGYSLLFGMTDGRNTGVGQQIGMQIAFSGTPFAADDGAPDGESTTHDRALGVMRVAFVDLDRMHADPASGVMMDSAKVAGGVVTRSTTVTTTALSHVVIGLRHLLMACNAAITQYGAPDPDPSKDALGILNAVPIHPPGGDGGAPPTFSARVRQVLLTQASFVRDVLTRADGTVANGASLSGGQLVAAPAPASLESQGAALRVLTEAWLLTHDASYQTRASAVARRLLGPAFWSDGARLFRGVDGGPDQVSMTADRFAWLQQALRETYKVLWVAGDPLLDRPVLEDRLTRVNKLFLNGWDDLDGNGSVDKATECLAARLQLGEQALTGELGTDDNSFPQSSGGDRDADCVPNIAYGGMGSVLAGEVSFHAP
jgi:hypothetical protein